MESVVLSRLVEYRKSLFEDEILKVQKDQLQLEALQRENAELRDLLTKERKDLSHAINQLEKTHQTEKTALNIRHQKEISQLTDRELRLYTIISELRKKPNSTQSSELDKPILPWDTDTVVNTIQQLFYCDRDEKLYYHPSVIDSFLRALQTNALIILSGPSGTGKSSLVTAFADALQHATASSISVQSSWTDKQDLFGYFNSIEKCFVPTEFLEKLMEAKASTGLHLISLDEMNLSHVEYYFAEILSSREQNKAIQLYPQRYYDEAEEIVSDFECIEDPTPTQINQYRNARELLKYHYQIVIPDNVRFIGTINMDHTVKPLSPKVIDRSFVIELTHQTLTTEEKTELDASTLTGKIEYEHYRFMTPGLSPEAVEPDVEWIIECSAEFHTIPDVRINARGKKQLTTYLQAAPTFSKQTVDHLIMSKLLPRIHFSINQHPEALETFKSFIDKLYAKGFHESATRANVMLQSNRYIKFFD
ncbi:AAA family ATPase [Exiguobacterium aurantiacum]|uniref:Replication factor C large subunit n=1 Tax=Exiguobacterium aurantiacum TaxID=33987 RepID=A0A377FSD2_9BACL|nr:AAA family ATPase [Exiguobacterium aurantiacum]STO07263.1 replication factor C large subunit [Exiguobacterium aurantiacum]